MDIGEGFPYDEQLLGFATSANVCCGEHAGSWDLTLETAAMCKRLNVRIGAHPGFPDRRSMGRHLPDPTEPMKPYDSVKRQTKKFVDQIGAAYIKPHGAWYQALTSCAVDVVKNPLLQVASPRSAGTLFYIVKEFKLPVMLLPSNAAFRTVSKLHGLAIAEGFADRAYQPDGALVPRTEPGAVLEDPELIKAQVLHLAPEVDSICLHGDTPGCLEFAELVYKALTDNGYEVAA